jgi:hypothetical protein
MNKAIPNNYKVSSEEKELLKKHLCRVCEMKLDNLAIKDLVSVMHQFCQQLSHYKSRYSGTGYSSDEEEWERSSKRWGETALKAQIKKLRHIEIDDEDYVECMNMAKLYSYPWYAGVIGGNPHGVSELYPLGNGCKEWLKA